MLSRRDNRLIEVFDLIVFFLFCRLASRSFLLRLLFLFLLIASFERQFRTLSRRTRRAESNPHASLYHLLQCARNHLQLSFIARTLSDVENEPSILSLSQQRLSLQPAQGASATGQCEALR